MKNITSAPLTKTQSGIYVESVSNPDSTLYNLPFLAKLGSSIDILKLKSAIEKILTVHPCLETVLYAEGNGEIMQKISEGICKVEITEQTDEEFAETRKNLVRPFCINGGCLARFEIYVTPSANYLFEDIHHIIMDGTSHHIIASDLKKAYDGLELSADEYTAIDVSLEEKTLSATDEYSEAKNFYNELLEGCDEADSMPVRDIFEDTPQQKWLTYEFNLDIQKLKAFRNSAKISTTAFFTGVMGFLVGKYNYKDKSVIATVFNGRTNEKLHNVVSMLVKTIPFVADFSNNPTVSDFLKKSGDILMESRNHVIYSFEEIASEYGVTSGINFAYQGRLLDYSLMEDSDMEVERLYDEKHIENSPLIFELSELGNERFSLHISYRCDMYSDNLVINMAHAYAKVASEFLEKEYVDDVETADDFSVNQIEHFNKTDKPLGCDKTIVEQFRVQAVKNPENTALVYLDKKFTYRELDNITDRLAKKLIKNGIGKDTVTGVLIPRCEYMVICALGILKAGGGYLPLDSTYPPERLNLMLSDSDTKVLITTNELNDIINDDFAGIRIMTDEIMGYEDDDTTLPDPDPEDLFIMLYTSGSTGLPKGVMLEHKNLIYFCDWAKRYYSIDESTRSAAYASYGFDANMFDTYPVLTAGGTLYIIDESIRLNLIELQNYFNNNGITHTLITTQVGRQFALMEGTNTLKHLTVGGEKLVPLTPPTYNMHNAYGPTEATVLITVSKVDKKYRDVPIGPALDNVKLYVVDKNGKLLPPGAAGELWASGGQVSRGYLNRPEQTAKAFTSNPFCNEKNYERVYHTGDVVRHMADGSIQFIGRRDAQVKVRGFRIELTEVEEIIRKFDGIKDATVAAFDDPAGGKYIAAYIVADEEISINKLNEFIISEKPPYMVPAVTMQIDKIPMNQNQKVNKKALPVPEKKFEDVIRPENEIQQKIFDIISDVIGNDAFGINTDIYLAGLTSVGAVRLNVLLSKAFDKTVQTKDLKKNNTVSKLEKFFAEKQVEDEFEILSDYPLTKNQEGIFVESLAHPDSTIYNIPVFLTVSDKLDEDKLLSAVCDTVNAHPYIKTRLFMNDKGDIRQKRCDDEHFSKSDIEIITADTLEDVKSGLVKPFELMGEKLFRIKLIKADIRYLLIEMHHIISDGTSMAIFLEDISNAYSGEMPEAEKFSAFEVSVEEERLRNSGYFSKAQKYYSDLFDGCDGDCLPNGDLKEKKTPESDNITVYGEYATADDVKYYCDVNKLSMNGFFTAVFGLVLSKFSRKEKSVFTTIYNGRNDSRTNRTVSMLVKTFPVLCDVSKEQADLAISDYVLRTGTQLMESMSNDIYSFSEISRTFGINADVMFAYQGEDFEFDSLCGEPSMMIDLRLDDAKAPLNLNVFIENGKIRLFCEYRNDKFSHSFISAFLDAFDMAVEEFITKRTVKEISVLSHKAEKQMQLFNDTEGDVEALTPPQLFERQAEQNPDKTAVIAGNESLTFKELNERANKIANTLIEKGVSEDNIIGLYMERCVDVYPVRQGIMKSGGAFMSTEPDYPDDRISYIFDNSKAKYVITTKKLYESRKQLLDSVDSRVLLLEDIYSSADTSNPDVEINPASLAYCIYTSGSTGKPKGVMIEHRNLMNMLSYHEKNILAKDYVDNTSVFLGLAAITFDVSVIEEMMPIYHGQTVAMATDEEIHNPLLLAQMMKNTKVDMMKCTPSYMQTMLEFTEVCEVFSQLRAIIIGAEPFPETLYQKMRDAGFKGRIYNSYGPTETTVTVTIDELDGKNVTIGTPAGNTKIYMLDCFDNILPVYAKGELVITGQSVGRGYLGLDGMTAEKFISYNGERAYRSGDIAYRNNDGKIIHCGRNDNQIKLRGLRVELDEIENVMNRFEGIKRSVVLVKGEGNDQFLCGYYTAESAVDTQKLTEFMSQTLTKYMIPNVFVHLTSMPMTVNGKVDKRALPEPQTENKRREGRQPKNSLEKKFCEIFAMALGLETVFADDDFFELGGTSLSASKVAMKCMTEKINVVYADVFDHTTPEKLAEYVQAKSVKTTVQVVKQTENPQAHEELYDVLKNNTSGFVDEISYTDVGNVLVTGATGFLGIHVVKEILNSNSKKIYCLLRKSKRQNVEGRLKSMLMYYFNNTFEEEFGKSIIVIEGDITDENLSETLEGCDFDTVINCAACVKHFVTDDLLDRVNVLGVKNLIEVCKKQNKKLIQISTVSVAGESVDNHIPSETKLTECRLDMGQLLDNKYAHTKFLAEKAMLEAIKDGLCGKVIRVGNLMSRNSDGEFQINYSTNGFMKRLRAYSVIGKFPVGSMDSSAEFSPIDLTAKAITKLAGTPDKFTVFHAYNCHHVHMANIISIMNQSGMNIEVVSDGEFNSCFSRLLSDEKSNMEISSLIAYMNNGETNRRYVGWDNSFTVKALYRLGFAWELTDEAYIRQAVNALSTLGFFGNDNDE